MRESVHSVGESISCTLVPLSGLVYLSTERLVDEYLPLHSQPLLLPRPAVRSTSPLSRLRCTCLPCFGLHGVAQHLICTRRYTLSIH